MLKPDRPLPNDMCTAPKTTKRASDKQQGLTLVELLVAMVIGLLISLAAIAALTVAQRGFTSVDAASQLRDNGRFAADLIQRLGVQSGFKDVQYAARPPTTSELNALPPNITGFNNALGSSTDPLNTTTNRTSTTDVGYGSDILILRNQLVRLNDGSNDADGSMIDCNGNTIRTGAAPSTRGERMASILSVAVISGEPSLMCATVDSAGVVNANVDGNAWQPIVKGVENFQVLYGVDGVTAGTAPTATTDTVPDKYLRADQMEVPSDPDGTKANWRRVRSLRIGMILRGPVNSAQNAVTQRLFPFGPAKRSSAGTAGSAMAPGGSPDPDPGTTFDAPADGRLRQVVTFTVHLRNDQGL